MGAATVASSIVDTTAQETLARNQSVLCYMYAGMPSMSPTMTRGVTTVLILAVLLHAKYNLAGDAPTFLTSHPTVPSSAATASSNRVRENNATTPTSLLATAAVPSA